jgi:hypothetical protein
MSGCHAPFLCEHVSQDAVSLTPTKHLLILLLTPMQTLGQIGDTPEAIGRYGAYNNRGLETVEPDGSGFGCMMAVARWRTCSLVQTSALYRLFLYQA